MKPEAGLEGRSMHAQGIVVGTRVKEIRLPALVAGLQALLELKLYASSVQPSSWTIYVAPDTFKLVLEPFVRWRVPGLLTLEPPRRRQSQILRRAIAQLSIHTDWALYYASGQGKSALQEGSCTHRCSGDYSNLSGRCLRRTSDGPRGLTERDWAPIECMHLSSATEVDPLRPPPPMRASAR